MASWKLVEPALIGLVLASLLFSPSAETAFTAIERYGWPRLDEVYMKVITDPDAATTAFQTCEVDFYPDMPRWTNTDKLLDEDQIISASPWFHFCYIGINCRDYVPDDAGQPDAARELAPLNWSAFRQALAWSGLSHDEKETAISWIYGAPVVTAADSPVPPALGVWHKEPTQYPGCNYTKAWEILQAAGFTIFGNELLQPNGVVARSTLQLLTLWGPPILYFTDLWVDKWNDFFGNYLGVTNCHFEIWTTTFQDVVDRAFLYRNFDAYFLCWRLDRFPNYLYDFFHRSQDLPNGNNSVGLQDAELDSLLETIRFSLDYEAKLQACYEAQDKLVFDLVPYVYIYSHTYWNVFKNYSYYTAEPKWLTGMVNMKGYGPDNALTWGLLHWNTDPAGGSVNYVLGSTLTNLHPGWAITEHEWDVLGRVLDSGLGLSPEVEDLPWMFCDWGIEVFVSEELGVNGSKARFQLREGVEWHDGTPVTAEDVKFALDYMRNFSVYASLNETVLWSQVVDPLTVEVYLNSSTYWIIYGLADVALRFPKHIYERPDSVDAELWNIGYEDWTGVPPPEEYPFMKALVGCGPFVFDYWNTTAQTIHLVRFQEYWVNGPLKQSIVAPSVVEPSSAFNFSVEVLNTGSLDAATDEFTSAILDYIEVYEDDVLIETLSGPTEAEPFSHARLATFTHSGLSSGVHTLSVKLYAYGELFEVYNHTVWSTIKEDVNLDCYVGIDDILATASAFGAAPGDPRWDDRCDVNNDYYVGIDDIFQIATKFGWEP